MSREIGFRVWDKENEEYINGYDVLLKCDGSAISRYALGALDTYMPVNVIIERDTGLKDKNGKRICEGDIVRVHHDDMLHDHNKFFGNNALVERSLSKGGAFIIRNWYGEQIIGWDIPLRFIEVIGNIHENPELLGGEE